MTVGMRPMISGECRSVQNPYCSVQDDEIRNQKDDLVQKCALVLLISFTPLH